MQQKPQHQSPRRHRQSALIDPNMFPQHLMDCKQNVQPESAERDLNRLRSKLQLEAKLYIEAEKKILVLDQVNRIHEKKFLAKTIEEYSSPQSRHNVRQRHFQLVVDKMNSVRRRKAQEMMARFNQYKVEVEKEEQRMSKFWKSRTVKKKETRPLTVSNLYATEFKPVFESRCPSTQKYSPRKSFQRIEETGRSRRIRSLQQENQQRSLSKYISKMQKAEQRIISNEISKEHRLRQTRSKPVRILTGVREQRYETLRRHLEEECKTKNKTHAENFFQYRKMKQALIQQKALEQSQHASIVIERKECLHESFMNKKIQQWFEDINRTGNPKENQSQKIVAFKRQLKIKKDQQLDNYSNKLRKLASKIYDLRRITSQATLPTKIANETLQLTKQLVGDPTPANFLTKSKQQLAIQYLKSKQKSQQVLKRPKVSII